MLRPRLPRRASLLVLAGVFVLLTAHTAGAFEPSGLLEIHHVNVQQGDCTLIIGPDGTTLLIDGGNNGKGNGEVIPYLQSLGLMPADGLDYMLATHRDADHLGGLDEVIAAGYDVTVAVWDNGSTKTNITIDDFVAAAATTTAGPVAQMPLDTVIALGGGATARCVAVNGDVSGFGSVSGATNNENDMAVAILVQYGGFDYITAGDLGGGDADNACTGRSTSQVDVETPLATSLMPGGGTGLLSVEGVEVLDVNHHGSESSTNSEFMNLLTPSIAVINVGAGQGGTFHHPRIDVVEHVLLAQAACVTAPPALVLQTEEGSPIGANTSFSGYCSGDIFITTDGVSTYTVDGTGAVSQGPDERAAAGLPAVFAFEGGGGGDTEAPVVTVFAPDGGETWDAGTIQNITWTATDNVGVTSIDLSYSTTGAGGPFTSIATGEANDGVYAWTVPDDPSTDAFVQVVAHDAAANSGADVSGAAFTIQSATPALLVINEIMQNPNASADNKGEWLEIYNPGGTAVDIDGWTIRDDGSDAHTIANGGPLDVPAGGYLVLGRNGNSNQNGGYTPDYVYSGFTLANGADEVILEDDQGSLIDRVDYTGSSPWPNPDGQSMELVDAGADNNAGSNWSEAVARGGSFTGGGDLGTPGAVNSVVGGSDTEAPVVTVLAPDGGESWGAGTVQNITWTATDNVGVTSIDLSYSTAGAGGPFTSIATGEANDGVYAWTVPDDPSTDAFVKVIAHDAAANFGEDASNAAFTLETALPVLVINEIMQNPDAVADTDGEWLELYNPGGSDVDIDGWVIRDNGADSHTIQNGGPLNVPAGGYLVLGRNGASGSNGGYTADYVYGSFTLANADDEVILEDGQGNVIDQVWYTGASPWPNPTGASMELADAGLDNDVGSNWAEATTRGGTFTGGGDFGTPGAANGGAAAPTLHVAALTVTYDQGGGNRWRGVATITVHDEGGTPQANVVVTGDWSGVTTQTNDTATTDGSGQATLRSGWEKNPSGTFCFDVTDLSLSGSTYDSGADTPQTPPAVCGPVLKTAPVPVVFELHGNTPNPFNPRTAIRFATPRSGPVEVDIFDAAGRRVATLLEKTLPAGEHTVVWTGTDDRNQPVASGVYLVQVLANGERRVGRMALVR